MKLTILGSGNAAGVPVYGCDCPACYRARVFTQHQRRNASALIEADGEKTLLDAGLPDLAQRFPPGELTRVLLTHYHMDHVQGLFHLRWGKNLSIPVIGPADPDGCDDLFKHPGILDFSQKALPFQTLQFGKLRATPLPLVHSKRCMGYMIEDRRSRIAYLTDTVGLANDVQEFLTAAELDLLIIDCTYPPQNHTPENHNDVDLVLELHQLINPQQTLLTHISHDFDAWLHDNPQYLPHGVKVAYDGLILAV